MRRASAVVAALAIAGSATACGGLEFTNDNRLSFSTPKQASLVTLPVTVRWSMTGFTATGRDGSTEKGQGEFAVFVDQTPIKVGENLRKLVAGAAQRCGTDPACPSDSALADQQVYLTTQPSVTLTTIFPLANSHTHRQEHQVIVVLVDGTGTRLTESAWYRSFDLEKTTSS